MSQKLATFWQTINFPGVSIFNRESEEPVQGANMTVMDILEFRYIDGPPPKGEIWTNKAKLFLVAHFVPPPPTLLGLNNLDTLEWGQHARDIAKFLPYAVISLIFVTVNLHFP